MSDNFQIKISGANFEGPIEVLLRLIEEKKMHISQVALAGVADDFVKYLESLPGDNKALMASFILVASTLMLIKSISLLPKLEVSEEERGSIEDLERRLNLYKKMTELSVGVKKMYGQKIIFARQVNHKAIIPVFAPSADLNLNNLLEAVKRVINNLPKIEKLPQAIVQKIISLEEAIENLARRVQIALKLSFKNFVKDKKEKVNVIVSFLGMLELVKRGIVRVEQGAHFADISIEQSEQSVPKYG